MMQNYDVIIIGGGIIGNSISAHLASEDTSLKILIVNSTNLGTPASIASAGLLTPFQISELGNTFLKDFCFKSFDYFPNFYETIKSSLGTHNIDLGYKQTGTLYVIFSITETSHIESEIKELIKINPKITFLNKQEALKYEPQITKEILGAYHYPNEGFINNIKFLKAITLFCIERGVIFLNEKVNQINTTRNKIENIQLSDGKILQAEKFVLCNGVWANSFLKRIFNLKEDIVKSIKGEILQLETDHEPTLQKILFCKEGYILPRPATNQFEKSTILVGSTSEEVNLEEGSKNIFHNTISGVSSLTCLFQKIIPNYKHYRIKNMWTGLRPKTIDNIPILGPVNEINNLYCALGHYRNGILMGPLTGKIICDLLLGNPLEFNIEPFKIERLLKQQVALRN